MKAALSLVVAACFGLLAVAGVRSASHYFAVAMGFFCGWAVRMALAEATGEKRMVVCDPPCSLCSAPVPAGQVTGECVLCAGCLGRVLERR